jgi:xanthine/uracil permease
MSRQAKRATAIGIVIGVLLAGGFMYLVTTFFFDFSGGQNRMGPVVIYGALAAMSATLVVAAITWRIRSPAAAAAWAAIATAVAWAVAIFVEWRISYDLGAG